jgi:hypothetical protein
MVLPRPTPESDDRWRRAWLALARRRDESTTLWAKRGSLARTIDRRTDAQRTDQQEGRGERGEDPRRQEGNEGSEECLGQRPVTDQVERRYGQKGPSNAGATLGAKKSTKAAKSAAGSALTQKPAKRARKSS